MTKFGIELGIRASQNSIERAAQIADNHQIEYFLVPETDPKFYGVDAFGTLLQISENIKNVKLGTGIVNVFSKSKEEMLSLSKLLYTKTNGRFVLGIGTSAPIIIENLSKLKFKNPLSRMKEYSKFIKSNFDGPLFWAAVGKKTTELAATYADGVLFFLKPQSQILEHIELINEKLSTLGRSKDEFEIILIMPTYIGENESLYDAKITLAGYIGANEFYSNPLVKAGYQDQVQKIRESYKKFGLNEAAKNVGPDLLKELTVIGSIDNCKDSIIKFVENTKLKTIILGFDLPDQKYNDDFFNKLDKLLTKLE